jgi:hypothetical protein
MLVMNHLENFDQFEHLKYYHNNIIGMGEINSELLSLIASDMNNQRTDDEPGSAVGNIITNDEGYDGEDSFESHFSSYDNLYSDSDFEFEQ